MTTIDIPAPTATEAAPTLADALAMALKDGPTQNLAKSLRGAVAMIERLSGRAACDLPADAKDLRRILRDPPVKLRMPTQKTMANHRWALTAILTAAGVIRTDPTPEPSPEWQAAVVAVANRAKRACLAAFARFATAAGVAPEQVEEATLEAYRHRLEATTLKPDVGGSIRAVRSILNRLARERDREAKRLLRPLPDPRRVALPASAFDPAFIADLERYLEARRNPDPLDPDAPLKQAETTVKDRRRILLRAATFLHKSGVPLEAITSLATLVEPGNAQAMLRAFHAHHGGRWTSASATLGVMLVDIATRHAPVDKEALERLRKDARMTRIRFSHLGTRAQRQIAAFDNTGVFVDLRELPRVLARDAERHRSNGRPVKAARLSEIALALAILNSIPIRRRNLVGLDLKRHVLLGKRVHISIPGSETKGGSDILALLTPEAERIFRRHVAVHRPVLLEAPSTALFPGSIDGHRSLDGFARQISDEVTRRLGVKYTLHLSRHLAVMLLLDDDPNNGPVAQHLLGHRDLKTTERMYGILRTRSAQQRFQVTVADAIGSARTRRGGKRRPGRGG